MHVLVALPNKKLTRSLSPLITALGSQVVPLFDQEADASELKRPAVLSAMRGAVQNHDGPAVFVLVHSAPEAILDIFLAEFSDCRAVIFYQSACSGLAHKVEAGDTPAQAVEAWLESAGRLLEFAKANSRNATLVCAEHVLGAPRQFLTFCENRFLFDLVDCAAKPEAFVQPEMVYRLVAAAAMEKTEALRAQDALLSERALDLDVSSPDGLSELDRFLTTFKQMRSHQDDRSRALAEADAMRHSAKLAETAVREAEQRLALEACNGTWPTAAGESGGEQDEMVRLQEDHEHLLQLLSDTQTIAERSVADLAELRQRNSEVANKTPDDFSEGGEGHALGASTNATTSQNDEPSSFGQRLNNAIRLRQRRQNKRDAELIAASGMFDAAWYLDRNSDLQAVRVNPLQHFVRFGGQEGRAPGPSFSSNRYLTDYPDVASGGYNPLVHYLRFGKDEGREIRRVE